MPDGHVNPHPDFEKRKVAGWDAFLAKDFEESARISARLLQDSYALDAIHLAGLSLTALDRSEEGFNWLCASLSLANAKPDWYANAAIACIDKKDYLHALLFIQNGIKDHPLDVRLSYMRGLVMCHTACWENAITFLDETIELDPDFYHAKMSKGFALHMQGKYEEAIEIYKSIAPLASGADREEIVNNHSCVLMELGRQQEALDLLDTEYPGSQRHGTLYNRSFLLLGLGDWPEAWRLYRYRATVQVCGDHGIPVVDQPAADSLDEIRGKHLFLFHEQGLGDTLQFIRYAHILRPMVSDLTIGVPKALRRMAETLTLDQPFTVVADSELDKPHFSKCDIATPMLDVPYLLGTTLDTIPNFVPYFKVPQDAINRNQLPETCWPRVGLCWAGASRPENIRAHSIDTRRSIPFETMNPVLELSDRFSFVSLQLPDHRVEDTRLLQPLLAGLTLAEKKVEESPDVTVEPLANIFDILDTAAVIQQLDLVITIDSSVAHIAGSLGKPTWLLSRYDGCWRWQWTEDESNPFYHKTPWYPSMYIFRQKRHKGWPEVVENVAKRLSQLNEAKLLFNRE